MTTRRKRSPRAIAEDRCDCGHARMLRDKTERRVCAIIACPCGGFDPAEAPPAPKRAARTVPARLFDLLTGED